MSGERRQRILAKVLPIGEAEVDIERLCRVAAEVTGMTGAGMMLMSGDVPRGSVCTTNSVSALIEELQYTLGEGPCVDAFTGDRPVIESDLAHPSRPRWVGFSRPAVDAGVRAIVGFPLQVGGVRLGALNLYRDTPGDLTDDQQSDGLVVADIAAQAVLVLQAKAPAGTVAAELEASADFQLVVHQACGMVAAQLDETVGHALIRLRAYAFANERPLTAVASDVVSRKLRFDAQAAVTNPPPLSEQ